MKRQYLTYLLTLLFTLCGISACTSVELCPEVEHPHVANVRARFNWNNVNKADIPDEVNIVASRIINTWRTHGIADTSKDPTKENNITYQQSSSKLSESEANSNHTFYLRGGEYNIFAINNQKISANTKREGTVPISEPETAERTAIEIDNLENYINNTQTRVHELYLHIKSMGNKKPDIVNDNDLPDFNPNYEYLENITTPIYHAVKKGVNVNSGQETIIDFDMQRISLKVNITFKIQLKANKNREKIDIDDIDSPIVELSGICGRFNISEAYLDTTKLYRMAYKIVKPENEQDIEPRTGEDDTQQDFVKESEDTYRCTARFNTLGVIPSGSKNHLNGPGIVQVAVKVWSDLLDDKGNQVLDETGSPKRTGRYIYAGINIRDELIAERLVEIRNGKTYMRYSKDDVNVEVDLPLIIEKDQIVPDDNGMGWIPADPTNPDGDIDIEI